MDIHNSTEELEFKLGDSIRQLRLQRNVDQKTLCAKAGISLTALRNLETGRGATTATFIKALRGLDHTSALDLFAPQTTINPLQLVHQAQPRQRARSRKSP